MSIHLSPVRLRAARKNYYWFNLLNSLSFVFLSGSFITLFALSLGASKALIGLLNSLSYATFFFLPLGKVLVSKLPIVKVFGYAWAGRYLAMIPVLFAPLFATRDHPGIALDLILLGTAGFNVCRGIALIGNNPVLALLGGGNGQSGKADRGAFLVNISIINSIAGMIASLLTALILGRSGSVWIYAASIGFGVALGLSGVYLLLKTPEPSGFRQEKRGSLVSTTIASFRDPSFRLFIAVFLVLAFVSGMARSFLPVYAKDVFAQGDDIVMIFSLAGSVGAIAMGLLTRSIMDRLGAKPLFTIYTAFSLASIVPIALLPGDLIRAGGAWAPLAFLVALHFAVSFSFAGEENAGQSYYFSLVPREKTLDLSVVYYFAFGLGGSLGSGIGGIVLDTFQRKGFGTSDTYRIFYGLLALVLVGTLGWMKSLKRLGSASIRESLGVMLSFRDLRAFDLLSRLDQSVDSREEARLIHEIGASASRLTQVDLALYLASPRFHVRMEALLALDNMPSLEPKLVGALVREVEAQPYTTAYLAARILGKHGTADAIPVLRRAAGAEDYMLQANALVALARLGDAGSRPLIEEILTRTSIPRVKLSAAYALELLGDRNSLPALIACLRSDDPPAFISDEIVLVCASLLSVLQSFYPLYKVFSENREVGVNMLAEAAEERFDDPGRRAAYADALGALFASGARNAAPLSTLLLSAGGDEAVGLLLSEAILDPALSYAGFRFFAAAFPVLEPGRERVTRSGVSSDRDWA